MQLCRKYWSIHFLQNWNVFSSVAKLGNFTNYPRIFHYGFQSYFFYISTFFCQAFNWINLEFTPLTLEILSSLLFITIVIMLNPFMKLCLHFRVNFFRIISHLNKIFWLCSIQNAEIFLHNLGNTCLQEEVYWFFLLIP